MRITSELAAAQARALREALAPRGVALRHTKALDLVCAAHGLRSREALKAAPEGDPRPNDGRLAAVAGPLATRDAARLATILAATTALTHPAAALRFSAQLGRHERPVAFEVPADAPREVGASLATPAGAACLATVAGTYYHTRYWRDGHERAMSLAQGSELGHELLHLAPGDSAWMAYERALGSGRDPYEDVHSQGTLAIDRFVEAVDEAMAGSGGVDDADEWRSTLLGEVAAKLGDDDDSSPRDLLRDWDRAEVVFVLGMGASDCEDVALQAGDVTLSAGSVEPDDNLRATMAALGYTMGEYRALSGNRRPTVEATRRRRVRADKLVPWEAVRQAIDEACSSYCNLVLYAQVPVTDLEGLDLSRPIRFSRAAFASYNALSGTFFDSHEVEDVVVEPSQGFLATCHGWYGPDEICGLVGSEYHGSVSNAA